MACCVKRKQLFKICFNGCRYFYGKIAFRRINNYRLRSGQLRKALYIISWKWTAHTSTGVQPEKKGGCCPLLRYLQDHREVGGRGK